MLIALAACSKEKVQERTEKVAQKVEDVVDDIAVPVGKDDPAAREKERFDEGWRGLDVFRNVNLGRAQGPPEAKVNITFVPNGKESFEGLTPDAINKAPVVVPLQGAGAGPAVL